MEIRYDQHFLKNEEILNEIVKQAQLKKTDVVLEVGAGDGRLTKKLTPKVKEVIAVEIDKKFEPQLKKLQKEHKNLHIIMGNVLEIIERYEYTKVVANIPYAITEPLCRKLIKGQCKEAVLMIGENFYKLLKGESKWNAILNAFYHIVLIREVSKENFEPQPRVNAVIIKLQWKQLLTPQEKIIQLFIFQDDKKVKNAIIKILRDEKKLANQQSKEELASLNIPEALQEKNVYHLSNEEFHDVLDRLNSLALR